VVVVVADPVLVERRRPRRLDAADDSLLGQNPQRVVHRLPRDGADLGANVLGYFVRRRVGPSGHRSQNGQSLGRDLDTVPAKKVGWII
jgi:hypothetical protein